MSTVRKCKQCGKAFFGNPDSLYCPNCVEERKRTMIRRTRVCQDCGRTFEGMPRSKRCPDCSYKKKLEDKRRYNSTPSERPLGSIDRCLLCGKEYIVKSGMQKYCSQKCSRIGSLQSQRKRKKELRTEKDNKKREQRRSEREKICAYCGKSFWVSTSENVCSDYCRQKLRQIQQCKYDLQRGYNRNLEKLLNEQKQYIEDSKENEK